MNLSSRSLPRSVIALLVRASPLLLTVLLYGYTVRLPFFLDDGPNFWFLDHLRPLQEWGGSIAFPYYRPVPFTLWKLAWLLLNGRYDPALMHLLNVLCLGLAGVCTGLLAGRLAPKGLKNRYTLLAGLGLVYFPFSYQAAISVAGLFHLSLLLGFTFSLWAATRWLDNRSGRGALLLCWLAAFFGIFSHENGPLLLPLSVGMVVLLYGSRSLIRPRTLLVIVPIGLLSLAYVLLWITLPHGGSGLQLSADPLTTFADLAEGLFYPVAMVARPFIAGDAPFGLILALLVVTVCVGLWITRSRLALYGVCWYFLGIALSVLLLAPEYVLGSPRLMALASVGAALFWAAVLSRLFAIRHVRWIAGAGVVAVVAVSTIFFVQRADDFDRLGDYVWRLARLAETLKLTNDDQMLVLNPPDFLAPVSADRRFLVSAEGASVMTDTYPYSELLWVNTGQLFPRIRAFASHNSLRPSADRLYVPTHPYVDGQPLFDLLHQTPYLVVTEFDGRNFWPVLVGRPGAPGPDTVLAAFGKIELLQAEADFSSDGQFVTVRLRWRLPEATAARPFVHVFCNADFIGQADLSPWGGAYPFSAWQPGETQSEIRQVLLNKPASPECLRIQLGVYYESNADRLKLTDAQNTSYPDDLYPVPRKAISYPVPPD